MKNVNNKRSKKWTMLVIIFLLFCAGLNGWAQTESVNKGKSISITSTDDGKVKLKVVTKEGNDSKTFEKTYESYSDIENDPDLEKYGIELDGLGVGQRGLNFGNHSFPSWTDDAADSFMFGLNTDSMREKIEKLMGKGFGGNNFFFNFGADEPFIMGIDSLTRNFNFNFGNGRMFFNDEEYFDIDSLRKTMKERFGNLPFDFDFDSGTGFRSFGNDDENIKIISRARVIIRSANDKDKQIAGTDKLDDLEIKDISFYPNPSDGRFNLEIETRNEGPLQVRIVSPMGKVVYDKTEKSGLKNYNFGIDISDQEKGIYILKVIQNNKALTKRVVVD